MRYLSAEKDGDFVVRISGEIDHHSAIGIREQIDRALSQGKIERLVMDLSATGFMDSSGLGLILGRLRKTKEAGIDFLLVNPTEAIVKILRLAGVEKLLQIQYL